jgi:hypothetical protein
MFFHLIVVLYFMCLSQVVSTWIDDERREYLNLEHQRQLKGSLLRSQLESSTLKHTQWQSPSNGTDILSNPVKVVKCFNQTLCIEPYLQLQVHYNIYMCKHINFGVRFYYLVREGLLLHPNVRMVHDIDSSDFIVYLPGSSQWDKSECGHK